MAQPAQGRSLQVGRKQRRGRHGGVPRAGLERVGVPGRYPTLQRLGRMRGPASQPDRGMVQIFLPGHRGQPCRVPAPGRQLAGGHARTQCQLEGWRRRVSCKGGGLTHLCRWALACHVDRRGAPAAPSVTSARARARCGSLVAMMQARLVATGVGSGCSGERHAGHRHCWQTDSRAALLPWLHRRGGRHTPCAQQS